MKNNVLFNSSTFLPRARYLCIFILAFVLGIGNVWAAADYDSSDWDSEAVSSVLGTHGSITISGSLGSAGNVSGHYYLPISNNLKNSDNPWNGYLGIASTNQIDSVEILYCPNGTNQTSIAWAAWGEAVTPNQYTLGHGVTSGTKSSKAWDNRVWEKINLSAISAYTVYFSRSIREFREIGGESNISNFGAGQTINVLGIRVWLHPSTPATTYTVTYKANGSGESDEVDDEATEIADNMFTYSGKAFTGWNTEDDGTGDPYEPGDEVEEDLTLYAQWSDIYTVTYDKNGGTGSMDATENEIVACTFTAPSGKGFKEWNTAANGKGTTYAVGATVTADLALYAIWQNVPTTIFHWRNNATSEISADDTTTGTTTGGTMKVRTGDSKKMGVESATYNAAVPADMKDNASGKEFKPSGNAAYLELALTSGTFQEGDTIYVTGYNPWIFSTSTDFSSFDVTDSIFTGTSKTDVNIGYEVIKSGIDASTIYARRGRGTSSGIAAIKVIRPAAKDIVSTVNTLTGVKLNGTDISSANLSTLTSTHSVALADALAEAPTITFNKHTVITYDDASTKVTDTPIAVEASVVGGNWSASTTIDAVTYTVTAVKLVARTVSYYDGTTKLGEEVVADGTKATAAEIETDRTLYTFDGWYSDAELTSAFNIASTNITADRTLYGKWTKLYATTTDFETEASAETAIATFAAAHNLSMTNLGSSEWDNGSKSGFVGYKLKNNGARLSFFVQAGKRVTFKFGSAANPTLTIGGVEQSISLTTGDNAETTVFYNVVSEAEVVLTTTSNSTVTLKSITIGDIPAVSDDATLSDLKVGGTTVTGFSAGINKYYVELPYGTAHADFPVVAVITNNDYATSVINQAKDRADSITVVAVTAQDGTTIKYYNVYFSVAPKIGVNIIKVATTGGTNKTVTGLYAGEGDVNLSSGKKMDTGKYIGFTLEGTTLQAGDKINVHTTEASNSAGSHIIFYDNMTDKNELFETGEIGGLGNNIFTINAAMVGEASAYVYRSSADAAHKWNGYVDYIAVYREMAPIITEFKIGDAVGVIDQDAKTIAIELPACTDVTSLTPTVTYYANGGGSITPTTAQDFTSAVNYTVSSSYAEDAPVTYAVTVTVAAPSENADLETLTVAGYALAFDKDVTSYDVVLDYGTAALPEIAYTLADDGATAVKVTGGVNGNTTITVTPAAGEAYNKVYTISFSVSNSPKFVIYDGSKMENIGTSGSDASGFEWSLVEPSGTSGTNTTVSYEGKAYSKCVNVFTSATKASENKRYFAITIPQGYVAKFRLVGGSNGSDARSLFVSKTITSELDASIAYATSSSTSSAGGMTSDYQYPGTYYLCATKSIRLYEFSVTLYPAYTRSGLTIGNIGTFCPERSVVAYSGASFYELGGGLGLQAGSGSAAHPFMLIFNEVDNLIAGMPYLFVAEQETMGVVYDGDAVLAAGHYNGFHGTLTQIDAAADNILVGKYAVVGTEIRKLGGWCQLPANRAYFDLSDNDFKTYLTKEECYDAPGAAGTPNPAPNRRRVTLNNSEANQATAIEYLYEDGVHAPSMTEGCYDVLGRKIAEPAQGGVYILNGKKVVIVK